MTIDLLDARDAFNPSVAGFTTQKEAERLAVRLECLATEFDTELLIRPSTLRDAIDRAEALKKHCSSIIEKLSVLAIQD